MTTNTATTRQHIQRYLQSFDFKRLFVEVLGWDNLKEAPIPITYNNSTYILRPLVEKRGVKVYTCDPDAQANVPSDPILRKIESELTRHAYQHIIIYVDADKTRQVWQRVNREQGKTQYHLNRYYKGQSGELLAQKLERLSVAIEEEGRVHHAEMVGRMAKAFDVERVTKSFYRRFELEHGAFLKYIQGITSQADLEWYTSLMLNRLMFIYFIQRKGFLDTKTEGALDGDTDYLSNHLKWVQEQQGEDQFHTFYRYFLLKLFHDGLSKRERTSELEVLLGNVPYLNGGLFDIHTLERTYPDINISDKAFENIFAFFNEFDWHLDDRPLRNDREINPDVLGYIFEKYINQKQMGAYYTKEDITEYISKSTIIPYIFDAAEQKCMVAFTPDGPVWSLLRVEPDRYIYDAVKKGANLPLLPEIEAGVHDVTQRGEWNKPAPETYALPTEIWREVVARRMRYQEVKAKLAAGEITSINDLITYNLDIVIFAEDAIAYCEGSDLLRAFYDSIRTVTVLDPTCGSGAFLFAALNILERLYEACLDRMQQMIEERDQLDAGLPPHKRQQHTWLDYFRALLSEADKHPSRKYFIYKSIIINNLYGVDIMEEATEICKLRLFLKLVSQINQFNDIEPLPDIDFNIRAGNTLVGFASYEETKLAIEGKAVGRSAFQGQMIFDDRLERIEQKAQAVERAFEYFRKLQTDLQLDPTDMAANKQQMREKLAQLRTELDGYLASEYGIDHENIKKKEEYKEKFASWQQSHQPFHWWVEFYGIMKRGGFDVIVGNPPYIEYSKVRKEYKVEGYQTISCNNLYAFVMERSLRLGIPRGRCGMIVPISLLCTERMVSLQELILRQGQSWHTSYSMRPCQLFTGAAQRLTITLLYQDAQRNHLYLGGYKRWREEERQDLLHLRAYTNMPIASIELGYFPKIALAIEESIIAKLKGQTIGDFETSKNSEPIYVHRIIQYFVKAIDFVPYFWNESEGVKKSEDYKPFFFRPEVSYAIAAILNSSLFYWFWHVYSDGFHCGYKDVRAFGLGAFQNSKQLSTLQSLGKRLMIELKQSTKRKNMISKSTGRIEYDEFNPRTCLDIIREIDSALARHYNFTDEELDYIINFDVKYRMGEENRDEGEE